MKVSKLIEYLVEYQKTQGDVDLDVEFAGTPKTPPPTMPADNSDTDDKSLISDDDLISHWKTDKFWDVDWKIDNKSIFIIKNYFEKIINKTELL